jgi:cell wall-associated NlpC family hydrolase
MAIPQIPDWRQRILTGVGVPVTPENMRFFDAWARAEGGGATNNPFNTTQQASGASSYNSVGVRNYTSPQQGIDATVNTLTNGRYGNIIGALRSGDSAMAAAKALANSPWGTGGLVQKILGGGGPTTPTSPSATQTPALPAGPTQLGGEAPQPVSRTQQLSAALQTYMQQAAPSPTSVRLLSALGDASATVAKMRAATSTAQFGLPPMDQPVTQTLGTMQSGSTDSRFQTIDVGKDFDGPVHGNAQPVVNMAMQYLGTPYLWGGADPRKGFDCSGFVQYLYSQAGVALPRTTYEQAKVGQAIRDPQDLQAGDILLFATEGGTAPTHEGMYIGGGQFIQAPHTGDVVKISSLTDSYYASRFLVGRRVIGNPQPPPAPKN